MTHTPIPPSNDTFQRTRRRLTLWYASVTALLLLILAVGLYGYVRATLIERIDDTLNHVVEVVERSLVIEPADDNLVWMLDGHLSQRVNVEASFRNNALFQNDDDRIDLEWFSAAGDLRWSTFNQPLPLPLHQHHWEETVNIAPDAYGDPLLLRQLTSPVQVGRQVLGYLRVSHPWFEVTKPTRRLLLDLSIGCIILVGAVGAIGWLLSGLAMRPIQDSYQRLKQFTADASHELRNPIAVIQANIQATLGDESLAQDCQRQLQVVERLTRRLGRLVDDLLFLARQDSGMVQPQWTDVDLDGVLLELRSDYDLLALDQGVTLALDFHSPQPEPEFRLRGDRDYLSRLFGNLLQNALHHTPTGGTISLTLKEIPDGLWRGQPHPLLVVDVQDTGTGIAPEELPHIFDRFYRSDPARRRSSTHGSGLGLAIVQAIVATHQGQIQVSSHLGQGTTFHIRLPVLPPCPLVSSPFPK